MRRFSISEAIHVLAVLKGIFVISLILSLFLWSIPLLAFNSSIWEFFQEKSGVIFTNETKSSNQLIIEFFKNGSDLDFLNAQELSHMEAVRNVISIVNIIFLFSFAFLILEFRYFSRHQKEFLLKAVRKTSLIVFMTALIISISILLNFDIAFTIFHKMVFVSNFAFPVNSTLKMLYPDGFFYGISAFYLLSMLTVSLFVTIISHKLKLK